MMLRKKASLNLSVNAIVVLILAITMLGLGLGFMQGMFGKITQKVDTAIGSADILNPPSADKPFTVSTTQITLNRGGSETVQIAYYNEGTTSPLTVTPKISCTTVNASDVSGRDVNAGDIIGWDVLISVEETVASGSYKCSFESDTSPNRYADLFVVVK